MLVVVDKLSKRAVFIPTTKDVDAPRVEKLFMDYVFSKYGVPISIISDRDPKFTAKYWGCMMELLNVRLNMASKDHPQTDGQSENMIHTLSNMLRGVIQREPEKWQNSLSTLEFEYNRSIHASTGVAPFEVEIGRIPLCPITRKFEDCRVKRAPANDTVSRRDACRIIAQDN